MSTTYEFFLPGVTCAACVAPVENTLRACRQVKVTAVDVGILTQQAQVTVADTDLSPERVIAYLKNELEDVGYECLPISTADTSLTPLKKQAIKQHWLKGLLGISVGGAIMACSMGAITVSLAAMSGIAVMSTLLTLYLGKESYQDAVTKLTKHKTVSMDSLFALSTLMALSVSLLAFVLPGLPMLFDAALLIFGFRHIGKAIEESAKQTILKNLSFRERTPTHVCMEGQSGPVATSLLQPGSIIQLRPGQMLPVDGVCLNEQATIYSTIITGNLYPQKIKQGDALCAGMRVPDHVEMLRVKVTARAADSYLALLDERIKQTNLEKAPLETTAKKMLRYFIPAVIAIAAVSAIVMGVLVSPAAAIQCAATVLVSACPCTFGLVTPLAIKIGIGKAAENGVQFKSGKSLQDAQQIDTVVFDLNGTLTTGTLRVVKSTIPEAMLPLLLALEKGNNHPVASAITHYIQRQHPTLGREKNDTIYQAQSGGVVTLSDQGICMAGNQTLMQTHKIDVSRFHQELQSVSAEHVIYFARDNQAVGYMLLHCPLRHDAKAVVAELQRMHKKVHICTGSDAETARRYAEQLQLSPNVVKANCPANEKLAYIHALRQQGQRVAMVGDAVNDEAAIEASEFGIAVKSMASDQFIQQKAGAVIHTHSLWPLVTLFTIANQTVNNIKQNLIFNTLYNVVSLGLFSGLLFAVGVTLNPAVGAALMICQTGLTLSNAWRFKRQPVPQAPIMLSPPEAQDAWLSSQGKLQKRWPISSVPAPQPVGILQPVLVTSSVIAAQPMHQVSPDTSARRKFSH